MVSPKYGTRSTTKPQSRPDALTDDDLDAEGSPDPDAPSPYEQEDSPPSERIKGDVVPGRLRSSTKPNPPTVGSKGRVGSEDTVMTDEEEGGEEVDQLDEEDQEEEDQEQEPSTNGKPKPAKPRRKTATRMRGEAYALKHPEAKIKITPGKKIYTAVYSTIPVYEMMVRGIGVMRRRKDSYFNATQILKVAGVEKARRTKILDRDIATGVHEKIQGGYGRYQGTWIPFHRALELAKEFSVSQLVKPIFDYVPAPKRVGHPTPPSRQQKQASNHHLDRDLSFLNNLGGSLENRGGNKRKRDEAETSPPQGKGKGKAREIDPDLERADKRPRVGIYARNAEASSSRDRPAGESPSKFLPQTHASRAPLTNGVVTEDPPSRIVPSSKLPKEALRDEDLLAEEKNRRKLMKIFVPSSNTSQPVSLMMHSSLLPLMNGFDSTKEAVLLPPDVDPDTPIDEQLHTPLHWASALGRLPLVSQLISAGSDISRGNTLGETALMRAILATNNYDADSFPALLELIGKSIRTADESGRTVLHHIVLIAGVKGRSVSARYYMEGILDYLNKYEQGDFLDLVDWTDQNGDTALNIAARVGTKTLVKMLLNVGADKLIANKLGLRAGDFGVEEPDLDVTEKEAVVADIRSHQSRSHRSQKPQEVLSSMTAIIESLSNDFTTEMKSKTKILELARTRLQDSAKELASHRRQTEECRTKCAQADEIQAKSDRLNKATLEEDEFDWTGRREIDQTPSLSEVVGPSWAYRNGKNQMKGLPAGAETMELPPDPPLPTLQQSSDPKVGLRTLLRQEKWYRRTVDLMSQRIAMVKSKAMEREDRCREVVALCCGVSSKEVDSLLPDLVTALETDGNTIDMHALAGFMAKVQEGTPP